MTTLFVLVGYGIFRSDNALVQCDNSPPLNEWIGFLSNNRTLFCDAFFSKLEEEIVEFSHGYMI